MILGVWLAGVVWAEDCVPFAVSEATTEVRSAFLENDFALVEATVARMELSFGCLDPATQALDLATFYQASARAAFSAGRADQARSWLYDAEILAPDLECSAKWDVEICALQTEVGAEVSNADLIKVPVLSALGVDGEAHRAGQQAEVVAGPHLIRETLPDGSTRLQAIRLQAGSSLGDAASAAVGRPPKADKPVSATSAPKPEKKLDKERNPKVALLVSGGLLTAAGAGTLALAAVNWNALAEQYAQACEGQGLSPQGCINENPEFAGHINTITVLDIAGGILGASGVGLMVGGIAVKVDLHGVVLSRPF